MKNLVDILEANQIKSEIINGLFSYQEETKIPYSESFLKQFSLDTEVPITLLESIFRNCKRVEPSLVRSNPFVTLLGKVKTKNKNWTLKPITISKGSLFVLDETRTDHLLNEVTPLGYFDENIQVPAVFEGERIWMSLVPHEILTMEKPIGEAKGKVLVYGLGLGYFALMVASKKDVDEVIIIEKEKEPIEIFTSFIKPHFEEAKKIKIIQEDAFKHSRSVKDGRYNFVFVDIYHDAEDGLKPYARFLKAFKSFKETKVSYWIEETLLTYARRIIEIILIEKEEGSSDLDYQKGTNEADCLINQIYFASKPYLDSKEILKDETIKKILMNL